MKIEDISEMIKMLTEDGWSLQVWYDENDRLYTAMASMPDPTGEYDFIGTDHYKADDPVESIVELVESMTE